MPYTLTIPDMDDDDAAKVAEELRRVGLTCRARAALLEAHPPAPTLTVGELALTPTGAPVRVDYIGRELVVATWSYGGEEPYNPAELTPTGRKAPEDWGQQ